MRGNNKPCYRCPRCAKPFGDREILRRHVESDPPCPHNCAPCAELFTTRYGLVQHWAQSRKHAFCQPCMRMFEDRSALRTHNEGEHYVCPLCRRVFMFSEGLKQHLRQSERPGHGGESRHLKTPRTNSKSPAGDIGDGEENDEDRVLI